MLFNSFDFFAFLLLVLVFYWSVSSKKQIYRNLILLISSYVFYSFWDYRFLSLIILSSCIDYLCGRYMHKSTRSKKVFLSISLASNLGILLFFKYYNFFIDSFAQLLSALSLSPNLSTLSIVLPVGISFYTFQTLSYTIDIYNEKIEPTKDFISFLAFVSFFPQLVAGPIERARDLLPQFHEAKKFDFEKAKSGLKLILYGLFKKVVIADNCARIVDYSFSYYETNSTYTSIIGITLFSIQIYCDFSGYSDIAIGVARLFNYDLRKNFSFPYFSKNINQFWKNWHISLSTWFRDYVYIPLGGSRVSRNKHFANLIATFTISGLWHGASMNFVIWGFCHGLLYLPSVYFAKFKSPFPTFIQGLITFSFVTFLWIFFRAPTLDDSLSFIYSMGNNVSFENLLRDLRMINSNNLLIILCFHLFVFLLIEYSSYRNNGLVNFLNKNSLIIKYPLYTYLYISALMYLGEKNQFIYFQF